MRSAFGVEHEVSKGIPKGLTQATGKSRYAEQRLAAHLKGKEAAQYAHVPKQYRNQGLPQHHLLDQTRSAGLRARRYAHLEATTYQPPKKGKLLPLRQRPAQTRRAA